jgi:DNA (cytosine-5)-methyltransferase 1
MIPPIGGCSVRRGVGASSLCEDRACGPSDLSRCASQPEALVPLRVLSLFAGIGGFDLGLERTGGFKTVAFCEIDPFCRRVLAKHWPGVPIYHDVRYLERSGLATFGCLPDVIVGGFPCQDISTAGLGAGIEGERSGLWSEYARLIGELRPRYVIVENVAALLNRGLGKVLGDLAALRYDAWWDCIPAYAVGAPHRRDRVWIVAYPTIDGRRQGKSYRGGIVARAAAGQERGLVHGGEALADADSERGCGGPSRIEDAEDARQPSGHPQFGGWDFEPPVGRVANGVPGRVDRLKQLGNAVVPQIPELIGRAILAAIAMPCVAPRRNGSGPSGPASAGRQASPNLSPKTCPS